MSEGQNKPARRNDRTERDRIYGHPLPISLLPNGRKHALGLSHLRGLDPLRLPPVIGVFDAATQSIWILRSEHARRLWERGFFGKGSLSRSEPTWLSRFNSSLTGPGATSRAAEEVTARRRQQRKQFKQDRAAALAAAVSEAEAAFSAGLSDKLPAPNEISQAIHSQVKTHEEQLEPNTPVEEEFLVAETTEDLEFLQLTLQEAFFLAWSLDALCVLDAASTTMSLPDLWHASLAVHNFSAVPMPPRVDNPFLVHYVAYHHFRSLGWVVRSGIKFCADMLLYKRGPVFTHAEFAVIVCPVYEDDSDRDASPFYLDNKDPIQWQMLSTVGRVNAQVHKTVIMAYVMIPSSRGPAAAFLGSPECLQHFSVREVVLRRWVPARLRD